MPLVTDLRILEKKYGLEDFQNVLRDYPLSWPTLWFKAFRNSYPDKSEMELMIKLVDCANKQKLPFAFSPYHALFHIFHKWIFSEWELYKKEFTSNDELIKLDKFLMQQFHDWVIRRDRFQCQLCGKSLSFKTAIVHHILPRYDKGYNNPKSKLIGPSIPLNLITLCKDCHNKIGEKLYVHRGNF